MGAGTVLYTGAMIRLGYPTQNLTIPATTNHTLRLASLGNTEKLRGIVRRNVTGLKTIMRWNAARGISLFRIGQGLIPFASHPAFPYDWEAEHGDELREAGELAQELAQELGQRLSMHPGQYTNPGSLKADVVERSLAELRYSARVLGFVGGPDSVLVLHVGGAYENRQAAVQRFTEVLGPEEEVLRYLAIENDERIWTVAETLGAARSLGVPAIVDTLHHTLNPGVLTLEEAIDLALPTWEARGGRPKLHLSSQDPDKRPGAHAYAVDLRDWQALVSALEGREVDVMIEAKGKEQALIPIGVEIG